MPQETTREQLIALAQKAGERRLTPAECTRLVAGIEKMKDTRDVAEFLGEDGRTLTLEATCEGVEVAVEGLTAVVPFERVTRLCAVLSGKRFDTSFRHTVDSVAEGSLYVWADVAGGEVEFTVRIPELVSEGVSLFDDAADAAIDWLKAHDPR